MHSISEHVSEVCKCTVDLTSKRRGMWSKNAREKSEKFAYNSPSTAWSNPKRSKLPTPPRKLWPVRTSSNYFWRYRFGVVESGSVLCFSLMYLVLRWVRKRGRVGDFQQKKCTFLFEEIQENFVFFRKFPKSKKCKHFLEFLRIKFLKKWSISEFLLDLHWYPDRVPDLDSSVPGR